MSLIVMKGPLFILFILYLYIFTCERVRSVVSSMLDKQLTPSVVDRIIIEVMTSIPFHPHFYSNHPAY